MAESLSPSSLETGSFAVAMQTRSIYVIIDSRNSANTTAKRISNPPSAVPEDPVRRAAQNRAFALGGDIEGENLAHLRARVLGQV